MTGLVIFSTLGTFATRLWLINYTKSHAVGGLIGGACLHGDHPFIRLCESARRPGVRFHAPARCGAAAVLSCAGVFTSVSISLFATIYAKISANLNAWENYDKPTKIEDAIVRVATRSVALNF